jgi:hypothetical protein
MSSKNEARRSALWGTALLCLLVTGIETGQAALISTFQAGNSSWHLGTLAVGNLDGTRDLEIVVPYRDSSGNWFLDAFKYTGQRLPGFPYAAGGEPINTSPTLCDLNHDGRDEIIFTRGEHVIVLRGNGSVMWSNTVSPASYVPNGGFETVTGGFYWYPSGAWLSHLPANAMFFSEVSPPIVADLNGNGINEILTAWKIKPDPTSGGQDYNPFVYPIFGVGQWGTMGESWSGGVVTFDAASGRQNFVYHMHQLLEAGLAVGRANPTGPLNVYALNDSDSVVAFDKSKPFGLWGKGMLHGQFGKNQRVMTGSYLYPIDIYTADIDGDGLDEVLVAGTQASSLWQPNETILDDDGGILWRHWLPHLTIANNFGWLNSACLIPINPDHDNHVDVLGWNHGYELTFRYWNGIELVNRPGWPKNFYPRLPTPPVVGDVDGDGLEEIVVGTYDPGSVPSSGELRIYALDGTLKQAIAVPGGIKQIPALADVEGVGRLDVVYRSTLGQIYVQNFGATGTNLVSWATHRGNMRRDGNRGRSLYPPGTPMVTSRTTAYNRVSFGWTNSSPAQCFRIYRAEKAAGPFEHIATTPANIRSYTDDNLRPGWQYFYEVGAVYPTNTVHSAPFAILALFNGGVLGNSGFERDDNCRWDKWYTGTIDMTNMAVSTNIAYQGQRSMQIRLDNQGSNGSIAQYNQYGIPDSTIFVTPGAIYSFGCWFKSTGLSQPSEHWLEWSSTKTSYDTNNRPPLPDPFYYTPHFVPGTGPVDWTYVNRTFQLPAGFPNIELRHRYTSAAPVTGSIYLDNVFFRRLPAPTATNWTTLVPFGSAWHYLAATAPAGWFSPNFNDHAWPLGTAKFGAGSGPTNVVTRLPQLLPYYYFRKQFTVPSADFEELLLAATCTDVSVAAYYPLHIYLNGNLVPTFIDAVTMAGNEVRYFDLTPFIPMLRAGTNTVAVQVGNYWSDFDNVAFDVSLKAVSHHDASSLRLVMQSAQPPLLSVTTPPGTLWQLQSCDALGTNDWQVMQVFTNTGTAPQVFSDTGQNGRPAPATVRSRVYRLLPF